MMFDNFAPRRILVLGDLILDRYTFGNAERVSPEAPVVVLTVDNQEVRLGGAASVAFLLRGLEAEVTLAGVVGDDADGRTLMALLRDERINAELVLADPSRPTTSKERIIGRAADRHSHQIVRVDHESRQPLADSIADELATRIVEQLRTYSVLLISDYSKGVCTPELLRQVIDAARLHQIPILIDPARIADYSHYSGATLLKPNRVEAELVSGSRIHSPTDALEVAERLREQHQVESLLVTLDREGMVLSTDVSSENDSTPICSSDDRGQNHFPTLPRSVYDITGAGDMVLAALGLSIANGAPLTDAVHIANVAAGLEIERLGVSQITLAELQSAYDQSLFPCRVQVSKSFSFEELLPCLAEYRTQGKSIVFTNGCFDLLHVGHVATLTQAAGLGDVLVVGVNTDASVRRLKGPTRPVIPEQQRAQMIAALAGVTHVVLFDEATPHRLLDAIRPDVLAKGGTTGDIIGREIVEAYGGQVVRLDEVPEISTTRVLAKITSEK